MPSPRAGRCVRTSLDGTLRSLTRNGFCAALIAAAALPAGIADAQRPRAPAPGSVVPGEVIVAYGSGTSRSERAALRARNGGHFGRRLLVPRTEVVKIDPDRSEAAVARAFERDSAVLYAEANRYAGLRAIPNDERFPSLWGLHNTGQTGGTADADIDAPEAWDTTIGSSGVVVAVVDTGLAMTHPDISPNLWTNPGETPGDGLDNDSNGFVDDVNGWDFADRDANPTDTDGHGTHVAGTAAARGGDGLGVTGVSQRSRIMPLKVFPDGQDGATNADIANAFAYAGANGAKVANASLGGPGPPSSLVSNAIGGAPGTLFVVAAGNDGHDNDAVADGDYPCNFPHANLICVAATGHSDAFASFTNYGATSVDLAAPGVSTHSTYPIYGSIWTEDFTADDFEANWTVTGSWSRVADPRGSGGHSLTDSPAGNYSSGSSSANNYARLTEAIDLTGRHGCRLDFDSNINVERNEDFLRLEASADGASWSLVKAYSYADGVAAQAGNWFATTASLVPFDGAPVHLRFVISSDTDTITRDGAYVDDLSVRCYGPDFGDDYASLNGTSMASPHVAGAAALVLSANPGAAVSFVRDALLTTVDPLPSSLERSRLVTGGRLNADAAVGYGATPPTASEPPPAPAQTAPTPTEPAPAEPTPAEPAPTAPQPTPSAPPPPGAGGEGDETQPRDLAEALFGFPRRLYRVRGLGRLRGVEAWSPTRSTRVRSGRLTIDPRLGLASDDAGHVRVLVRASLTASRLRGARHSRLRSRRISLAPGRASRVRLRVSRSALKALRSARRGRLVIDITVVDSAGHRTRARTAYTVYPPRASRRG